MWDGAFDLIDLVLSPGTQYHNYQTPCWYLRISRSCVCGNTLLSAPQDTLVFGPGTQEELRYPVLFAVREAGFAGPMQAHGNMWLL